MLLGKTPSENINSPESVLIVLEFTGHRLPKPYPEMDKNEVIYTYLKDGNGHISLKENSWKQTAHVIDQPQNRSR